MRGRAPVGQRQEVQILLPAALLALAMLSTFLLFAYSNTVELLLQTRQDEARYTSRQLAGELSSGPLPEVDTLRKRLPTAVAITVLGPDGRSLVTTGTRSVGVAGEGKPSWKSLFSPPSEGDDTVSARVSFDRFGRRHEVQVDLPAPVLRSRQRGLLILTPLVLVFNGALTVGLLVFLRRFLAPIDRLMERARSAGRNPSGPDDLEQLVDTFEAALAALSRSEVDELEALQGTLGRSIESGVLLCDLEGRVLALNEIGSELLGVNTLEVGQAFDSAFPEQSAFVTLLQEAVREGRPVEREECVVKGESGDRTLGLTVHPLRRDDTTVRGFLALFADLTEVKAAARERHLAESLAQLGELSAGVAHELRNSLASLRGYLGLLERDPSDEARGEYLEEIRRESDHLTRVLEDFLTFARPGSVRAEDVDLLALAHRAAADPALGEASVRVRSTAAPEEVTVHGDAQLLERALRNVLSNAIEAQRSIGVDEPLEVLVGINGEVVEISIRDHGPGIDEEKFEKLFDPFITGRPEGVGLGLALTRRIVLLHAGRIVASSPEDGGALFLIELPIGKFVTESSSPEG